MKELSDNSRQILTTTSIFEGEFSIDWILEVIDFKASDVLKDVNRFDSKRFKTLYVENMIRSAPISSMALINVWVWKLPDVVRWKLFWK